MRTKMYVFCLILALLGTASLMWSSTPTDGPPVTRLSVPPANILNTPPDVHVNTPLVFTLTQGDNTYSIPVLEEAEDVVGFYNYYSASSHTGYEVAYESKVFLYRNTIDNSLHLVITHNIDYPPPTGSGRVDFDLSGIPSGAYVSQSDDPSHMWDPPRSQEFSLAYPDMEGHWYYTDNTDGGVLSGLPLDVEWCITINPLYFDNINRWIYHFGSGDPIELDMGKPVTICYTPPEDPEEVSIDEGGQVSFSGFFDDPDAYDTHNALWIFGDSNDSVGTFSPGVGYTHHDMDPIVYTYGDNGDLAAFLVVADDHGGVDSAGVSVTVSNIPPAVDAGSDQSIEQGETVILSAGFTDPGWRDTHIGIIDWGDMDVDTGTVVEENDPPDATGTVTATHFYDDCDVFTVSVTVIDDDGGSGVNSIEITVIDATPPEVMCPPDTVLEADEGCEGVYTGPPASAVDNCDPDPDILSIPALPATFSGLGAYTITWIAVDESGNADTCFQTIEVVDVTPPDIACPSDTSIEADANCEVVYAGPPAIATDNCDPDPLITSDPALPATFAGVGDHYIVYTATDASGNSSSCTQTVTIIDVTPPEISCPPDQVLEADENCEAVYSGPPAIATDNCDPDPLITSDPALPSTFAGVGDHYIVYTATDASGNSSSCTQTVTIVDVTPPEIACPPDVALEPEGFDCAVTYGGPPATAVDNCDESPLITSEPMLPATFRAIGDHQIVFRAEDFSGNASVCTMTVTVLPTSSCLKGEAVDFLLVLKPTGDSHLDKEIDKVIWHIEKSLEEDLWLDVKRLGCKHGHKVFNEEKTATVHLVKEMNKKKFPPELGDDFVQVIMMLLDADDILAKTQLDDAIALGGDEKHIERAKGELVLAWEKRDENDYMHAIDHYRKAWDEACKAIAKPPGDGVQVGSHNERYSCFSMSDGVPNPFGKATRIAYEIPQAAHVTVRVYDLSGRLVRILASGVQDAGGHHIDWDGRNALGERALPGIYFIRLTAGDSVASRKIIKM